jgi:hypothetical protein
VATALLDPYGHGERLVAALRGGAGGRRHLATNAWVFDDGASGCCSCGTASSDGSTPAVTSTPASSRPTAPPASWPRRRSGRGGGPAASRPRAGQRVPGRASGPAHWHWNIHHLFLADPAASLTPEADAPVAWFPIDALPEDRVADLDELLALLVPLVRRATGAGR